MKGCNLDRTLWYPDKKNSQYMARSSQAPDMPDMDFPTLGSSWQFEMIVIIASGFHLVWLIGKSILLT